LLKRAMTVAALSLLVGAGLGTYFAIGGSQPAVPKSERSALLEKAKARGIIQHYRVLQFHHAPCRYSVAYGIDSGEVAISYRGFACGPGVPEGPEIWYTDAGVAKALAIWKIGGGALMQCGPCSPEKEAEG